MQQYNRMRAHSHVHEVSSLGQSLAADEIAGSAMRGLDAIQRLQLGKWYDVEGCHRRGKLEGAEVLEKVSQSPVRSHSSVYSPSALVNQTDDASVEPLFPPKSNLENPSFFTTTHPQKETRLNNRRRRWEPQSPFRRPYPLYHNQSPSHLSTVQQTVRRAFDDAFSVDPNR